MSQRAQAVTLLRPRLLISFKEGRKCAIIVAFLLLDGNNRSESLLEIEQVHVQNLLILNKLGDLFSENGHILICSIFSNRQGCSVSDKQICCFWSVHFFKEISEIALRSQKDLQLFTLAQILQRCALF